jgi:Adaptin C-terminal domain
MCISTLSSQSGTHYTSYPITDASTSNLPPASPCSDFTECPLYTNERHQRKEVDLAKATFIRPGSNKADAPDTPAHSFDIVTTEREWTLCAESQENVQKWLKLLTRAVDEDVAILPDEDLTFKVKPKVDPLGELCTTDYTTTLRVSANGVSVCVPDPNGGQGGGSTLSSITGGSGAQKEMYFWVYTDFYKWSLIKKDEKLALLVNVFADSSFSRRNEFIFRQKESERLATAIEFFIEKFMSVMHIRLETTAGAFDDVVEPAKKVVVGAAGMHTSSNFESSAIEDTYSPPEELDLLGLDIEDEPPLPPARSSMGFEGSYKANQGVQSYQQPSFNDNPFGDDPFGEAPAVKAKVASHNVDPFDDDIFKVEAAPIPAYVPTPSYVPAPSHVAAPSFAADPFGDDPFAGSEQSSPAPVASYAQSFGDDPFGSPEPVHVPVPVAAVQPVSPKAVAPLRAAPVSFEDPFGPASSLLSTGLSGPLIAPPLTPQQLEQHTLWLQGALTSGGGPLYDDGNLQIASKIEVRGSQGRITIYYRSLTSEISEFNVSVKDTAGLVRCQLSPLSASSLSAGGQTEQQLLVECMQPASPGPQLCITYLSAHGRRTVAVDLPLVVTTFNEPLALSGADFSARWDLLVSPGQEAQEVLSPPRPVVPREIHSVLTAVRYALYFCVIPSCWDAGVCFVFSFLFHISVSIIASSTSLDPLLNVTPHPRTRPSTNYHPTPTHCTHPTHGFRPSSSDTSLVCPTNRNS